MRALRAGAADFIEKPWENTRLISILRGQLSQAKARSDVAAPTPVFDGAVIGRSSAMRDALEMVAKIAATDVPVLLTGGPVDAKLHDGRLADLAPTLLALLGLPQPEAMTGRSLIGA